MTADAWITLHLAGHPQPIQGRFLRGDSGTLGETLVEGRWLRGRGEVVAPSAFLVKRGLAVGDRLTLTLGRGRAEATVVGATMDGAADLIQADWRTLAALAPDQRATQYEVRLAPGTDVESYNAAVRAADSGLHPVAKSTSDPTTVAVIGFASLLTVLLGTVSALGAAGGLLGIPIGVAAHRLVVPAMAEAAGLALPAFMVDVWRAPLLALLTLAGVVIAVLGALVPARSAARLTIAAVLHNE
ncbi:hypothetical protein [Nonomuraea sp. GTA35]|uniref:hypothetical protein n=1 Tax=Nonomuraea sp. GTA35 TaxID=1676746 RepID=UPI0035BF34F7